ncbi:phosphorus acquisition-controlling protein [Stagonosporopsis vannaccii]|nr:phosphorus acquisition-controlling protein [Stagonosporopsis vannaccii]
MDSGNAQSWPGMDAAGDQDFGNLIDFNHFDDLDLPDFNNIAFSHDRPQNGSTADAFDHHHLDHQFPPQISQNHGDGATGAQQAQTHSLPQANMNASFFDYGMSHFSQAGTPVFSQAPEQVFRPHHGVPPTPNSVEMHGDPHRYMQQMDQQALYDQRYLRKDDASFTPLVSPAVTPHDARFQIPDFTVPGAYFSPLTSPALNAQAHQHAQSQLHSQASTSASSTGHSPIDVDMDLLGEPAMAQPAEQRRSLRTKRNPPRATPANRVRQSPIVKPGRRKPTVSMQLPPKEVSELMHEARNNGLDVPRSRDQSETDSISPEPMLSDMRPPPLPGSVKNSPALIAQNGQGTAPATPASLMRIHPSPQFDASMNVPPLLEDLALPEASLESRPSLSRLDTAFRDAEHDTPRMSARKTPKLGPLSTPGAAMSNKPSPMLDAMSTPTSPAFSMTSGKKVEAKGRNAKKRGSVSSSLVSPALRPKISPSIRPMMPAGDSGHTDNTHALLLASKSNYQNILDGTTVPGVSYPASLSTNLTSKRTSHKIAEQGRRNRINTALQEMQDLLPPSSQTGTPDAKSPPETAAQSNNSKAAKVESAIEYIKQLKGEVSAKDKLLEQKDAEMESLRKQLAQLRRGSSADISSNESVAKHTVEEAATAECKKEPVSTPAAVDET